MILGFLVLKRRSVMRWIIIALAVLMFLVGPIRKRAFAAWLIVIPFILASIAASYVVPIVLAGAPRWAQIAAYVFFIGCFIGIFHEMFTEFINMKNHK